MVGRLRITWKKSAIGAREDQRATLRALGLRRLQQTVEREDNPTVRGLVRKVQHLVDVAEVPSANGGQRGEQA